MKRIVVFVVVVAVVWMAENWWLNTQQAAVAGALSVEQLNGGGAAAERLRGFRSFHDLAPLVAGFLTMLAAVVCFAPALRRGAENARQGFLRTRFGRAFSRTAPLFVLVVGTAALGGCMKSYDRPEYVEIDTSETGFLISLEGETGVQAKFQSVDYLQQRKVAAKRVQILHRWSQEGRMATAGRWIATVRLVKVNRSPVTREWLTPQAPIAGGQVNRGGGADKAIWIESSDSVGFSMGFTCTAFIAEDDAATFLYWYPSGSLGDVMDHEIRGRIQQIAAEVAAKYPLDLLRSRKQEISDAVKQDLTSFFNGRGITITTVGMFGGMTYENPAIQKSIDETFIAQQLKVVAEAKFEAQKQENERIQLEARSMAEKAQREAEGLAASRRIAASAEAEAIREINKAAQEAQANPLFLQLKSLEVEKGRVEKWDGRYPTWMMGGAGGTTPNLMLQIPGNMMPGR